MQTSAQAIRENFVAFFQQQHHVYVPASPITQPSNDQLRLINAGVVPLVPYVLAESAPPARRLVNSQPCLRVAGKHNDLAAVGHDTCHHTLFDMWGHWSFGDYTPEKAIPWARGGERQVDY